VTSLLSLVQVSVDTVTLFFLVLLRIGAFISLLPGFGERVLSVRLKAFASLSVSLIIFPLVQQSVSFATETSLPSLALNEASVGLLLGIGVRLFLLAVQTAGVISAQTTSISQIFGGANTDPMPALGYTLIISAIALFMVYGLHIKAIELILLSYDFLPMGNRLEGIDVATWGIGQVAYTFGLAFMISSPFIIVSVIYNIAIGVVNRAMPQLMVAFVGAPFITFAGLLVFFLTAPAVLATWVFHLDSFLRNPFNE
jgi:flagellar biosynthetic protein FliR